MDFYKELRKEREKELREERDRVFEMYKNSDGRIGEKRLETIDQELSAYAERDRLREAGMPVERPDLNRILHKNRWGIDVEYAHEWKKLSKDLPLPGLMGIILEFYRKVKFGDSNIELMFWSKNIDDMNIYFFSKEYNCANKCWNDIGKEELVRDSILIGDANELILGLDEIELDITKNLTIKLKDYRNEILSAINSTRDYSASMNKYSKLTDEAKNKLRSNAEEFFSY